MTKMPQMKHSMEVLWMNGQWLLATKTQAVPLISETSALIRQIAEHIELRAEEETGVSPEVLPLSSV